MKKIGVAEAILIAIVSGIIAGILVYVSSGIVSSAITNIKESAGIAAKTIKP